ncbi:MAG: outer membrane lipid asymmetry maintenance protein MlaD [Neisseriaceae bacterium]
MKQKTIELWVGLLVLLGILATIFLCVKVAGEGFLSFSNRQGYQVVAYFDNVGGLKLGAPVRSSGVLVGLVTGINLDQGSYRAKVTLRIDKQYSFSQDTIASIVTMGILGEQYVSLQQGGDPVELKPGDKIKVTNSALVVEELVNKFLVNVLDHSKP